MRKSLLLLTCFFVVVFSVLAAAPGWTATLRVPTDYPTIQDAVDAAIPGDTVLVFNGGGTGPNGEYQENVVVDKSISLVASPSAVIDVSDKVTTRAGADYSAGITVLADGVTVEGFTVKFAHCCDSEDPDPACPNNDTWGVGIDVLAHGFVGVGNTLIGNEDGGIIVMGDGFHIFRNIALGNLWLGFGVNGDGGTIESNEATRNVDLGFLITGDGITLSRNKAVGSYCGFLGEVLVSSTVRNNKAVGNCLGFDCDECQGVTFERNQARENSYHGFSVWGLSDNITFSRNKSLRNGGDGFWVGVDDNVTVVGNTSNNNAGDGIDVEGSGLVEASFEVTGVVINSNKVKFNEGTGIENDAADADINYNTVKRNYIDIAGAGDDTPPTGSVGSFVGNDFVTGGPLASTPGTGPEYW